MIKKIKSVRFVLFVCLLISIIVAATSTYYKVKYWGFSFKPKQSTGVWSIEEHISFMPTGEKIKVSITTPEDSDNFKVLDDSIIATGYVVKTEKNGQKKLILTSNPRNSEQNIYYRVMLFDNEDTKGLTKDIKPQAPKIPQLDERQIAIAKEIIELTKEMEGDLPEKLIHIFNQKPAHPLVSSYLPFKISQEEIAAAIRELLAIEKVSSRVVKGVKLEEGKKSLEADLMVEAYIRNKWRVYNIGTGKRGIPGDFVIFQRGDKGLVDIEGGEDSSIQFSVLKSLSSNFDLASHRARIADQQAYFDSSIFSLPLNEQNIIKWLSVFPLAILIIVIIRNVIGLKTMGTFTPMLIAMSLVQTGFVSGMISFSIILIIGMLLRGLLSKLNLLLVPRISAVVIFVIIIMQAMTIIGQKFSLNIGLSAVFFPIIIMAWIIERASITWEEDGAANATREIVFSLITAVMTYLVVSNEYIRHITYAFGEINYVILFLVMLLGTYTGYRLLELTRFAPLVKG
ncbi:MAG: inactive transglutaminase family protein [Lactobacillaceae bacterium]|jgi:hypothetical protein|nr:inactive transglutaminase family protein [Lactobacillaceae bacterium]